MAPWRCADVRRDVGGERDAAWWDDVLAGRTEAPHPIYGEQVKVRLTDRGLVLSGELDSRSDRDRIVREARSRIGGGARRVDASRLRFRRRSERRGVTEQTLIAAYRQRAAAELARRFVVEHSGVELVHVILVEKQPEPLSRLAPAFAGDARRRLDRGETLLVMKVDEVDAFRVRALLEQATHSTWTAATPPELPSRNRAA